PGRHPLGEAKPEPFLDRGQTEAVRAGVLGGEPAPGHLAEEHHGVAEPQRLAERADPPPLRTRPYDAHLDARDSVREEPRGAEEVAEALAGVHPADREDDGPVRRPPFDGAETERPLDQVDRPRPAR